MAVLREQQRIDILTTIFYGDEIRTQAVVDNLFNNNYPDRPITDSTVSKVETEFITFGNITENYKKSRPGITDRTVGSTINIARKSA